ncbi:Uncharacterized protein TCM_034741 [Theobroma cacao]|uniref:Uncharacterized protein n=1 Tax=Theobroma cacao TaxID=3641 RepID=A0A061FEN5_THECC|nr:Uncharacterized protein TCM_034741 [Theobroma cacao]
MFYVVSLSITWNYDDEGLVLEPLTLVGLRDSSTNLKLSLLLCCFLNLIKLFLLFLPRQVWDT